MRIEIHAETEAEKAKNKEPVVLNGVKRFGIAGIRTEVVDENGKVTMPAEFGHIDGPILSVKSDFARVGMELDHILAREVAIDGHIKAHNLIVQQQEARRLGHQLNGKQVRLVT